MDFFVFCKIDEIIKKYTEAYTICNKSPSLDVELIASVTDEEKEYILNELDFSLRDYVEFSHEYENGKLQITFN